MPTTKDADDQVAAACINWVTQMSFKLPLIAISVLSRDDGAGSIENQVAGVVKKPVSRNALKSTVRHALGMGAGH